LFGCDIMSSSSLDNRPALSYWKSCFSIVEYPWSYFSSWVFCEKIECDLLGSTLLNSRYSICQLTDSL
jgi:phospholipase C